MNQQNRPIVLGGGRSPASAALTPSLGASVSAGVNAGMNVPGPSRNHAQTPAQAPAQIPGGTAVPPRADAGGVLSVMRAKGITPSGYKLAFVGTGSFAAMPSTGSPVGSSTGSPTGSPTGTASSAPFPVSRGTGGPGALDAAEKRAEPLAMNPQLPQQAAPPPAGDPAAVPPPQAGATPVPAPAPAPADPTQGMIPPPVPPMAAPPPAPLPANPRPNPPRPKTSDQAMQEAVLLSAMESKQRADAPVDAADASQDIRASSMAMGKFAASLRRQPGWHYRLLQHEAAQGRENVMPSLSPEESTPVRDLLSSPGKGAVLYGLLGAGLGGLAGAGVGSAAGSPAAGAAIGAGAGGLLSALTAYSTRKKRNDRLLMAMRDLPPNAVLGDMGSEKVAFLGRLFQGAKSVLGKLAPRRVPGPNLPMGTIVDSSLPSVGTARLLNPSALRQASTIPPKVTAPVPYGGTPRPGERLVGSTLDDAVSRVDKAQAGLNNAARAAVTDVAEPTVVAGYNVLGGGKALASGSAGRRGVTAADAALADGRSAVGRATSSVNPTTRAHLQDIAGSPARRQAAMSAAVGGGVPSRPSVGVNSPVAFDPNASSSAVDAYARQVVDRAMAAGMSRPEALERAHRALANRRATIAPVSKPNPTPAVPAYSGPASPPTQLSVRMPRNWQADPAAAERYIVEQAVARGVPPRDAAATAKTWLSDNLPRASGGVSPPAATPSFSGQAAPRPRPAPPSAAYGPSASPPPSPPSVRASMGDNLPRVESSFAGMRARVPAGTSPEAGGKMIYEQALAQGATPEQARSLSTKWMSGRGPAAHRPRYAEISNLNMADYVGLELTPEKMMRKLQADYLSLGLSPTRATQQAQRATDYLATHGTGRAISRARDLRALEGMTDPVAQRDAMMEVLRRYGPKTAGHKLAFVDDPHVLRRSGVGGDKGIGGVFRPRDYATGRELFDRLGEFTRGGTSEETRVKTANWLRPLAGAAGKVGQGFKNFFSGVGNTAGSAAATAGQVNRAAAPIYGQMARQPGGLAGKADVRAAWQLAQEAARPAADLAAQNALRGTAGYRLGRQALPTLAGAAGGAFAGDDAGVGPYAGALMGAAAMNPALRRYALRSAAGGAGGKAGLTAMDAVRGAVAGNMAGMSADYALGHAGFDTGGALARMGTVGGGLGGAGVRGLRLAGSAGSQGARGLGRQVKDFGQETFMGPIAAAWNAGGNALRAVSGRGTPMVPVFGPVKSTGGLVGRVLGVGGAALGAAGMAGRALAGKAKNTITEGAAGVYRDAVPMLQEDMSAMFDNYLASRGMLNPEGQFDPTRNVVSGLSSRADRLLASLGLQPERMSPAQKLMVFGGGVAAGGGAAAGVPALAGGGALAALGGLASHALGGPRGESTGPYWANPSPAPQYRNEWEHQAAR